MAFPFAIPAVHRTALDKVSSLFRPGTTPITFNSQPAFFFSKSGSFSTLP